MNSDPKVFAEYKSVTSTGALVDMSKRHKDLSPLKLRNGFYFATTKSDGKAGRMARIQVVD